MKTIEVEWEVKPKSGITEIDLKDLGCKNKKEWIALDKQEQERRLNIALIEYDGGELKALAKEWD
jgi:hypothetical protein